MAERKRTWNVIGPKLKDQRQQIKTAEAAVRAQRAAKRRGRIGSEPTVSPRNLTTKEVRRREAAQKAVRNYRGKARRTPEKIAADTAAKARRKVAEAGVHEKRKRITKEK